MKIPQGNQPISETPMPISDTGDAPVQITVVVCTRNRGDSAVQALETIFENTYPNYEVIVVDQSTNDETELAIAPFKQYPNFRYIHSETIGTGRSRNIGLLNATGDIVAYTDDDCSVPPDWLEATAKIFIQHPRVALVYFNVEAGPHDTEAGYIPDFIVEKNRMLHTLRDSFPGLGLGAGMALRREAFIQMGGFDNNLGPGSKFRAAEDRDIAIRALIFKWWVYHSNDVSLVHFGFRPWQAGIEHSRRDWYGLGATYIKAVRCGYWRAGIVLFSATILQGLFEPILNLLRLRRPRGLRRWFYYFSGIFEGLRTPVDCKRIVYLPD
jgi:glycosyltransferase involved in cell wall biosynthesis